MSLDEKQELDASLARILSMPKDKIRMMKKCCIKSEIFLYRHYEKVMKELIEGVVE